MDLHRCEHTSPPEWTGHWRDWHRGHGCHLDPDKTKGPLPQNNYARRLLWEANQPPQPDREYQCQRDALLAVLRHIVNEWEGAEWCEPAVKLVRLIDAKAEGEYMATPGGLSQAEYNAAVAATLADQVNELLVALKALAGVFEIRDFVRPEVALARQAIAKAEGK